ncbi:hypothetical protein B0H16DRAFT_1528147 [Mycena metata]|uniref:Uncharacterized protein n=1 Tax=Mycena metata TaxID=1033252 RepID=A0AAD7NJG7_9AGAR|nr:hypothetical protein B0H16DRAFT_1528147 [Mycena metata]
MDITGGLNFSIGAKIPAGAVAQFVIVGEGNSSATGWNPTFDFIPFRLNSATFIQCLSAVIIIAISRLRDYFRRHCPSRGPNRPQHP